ncbi:MAG: Zn-ribbon domain-containing OB-fold protein [Actinobacteria bacterium]|nr:MAG: Zn-ribbon domain-containing OB-fold protein [Actinomycetota bacterium]
MLEKITNPERVRIVEGAIPVRHRYTPGVAGDRFFRALRDKGEILATPCTECGVTYVPGRMFCERCFAVLEDWVRVGPGGTLESYTAVHVGLDGETLAEPAWIGLAMLSGATTVLVHRLEPNGTEPWIGAPVEAILEPKAKRTGSINDIRGFRLL